MADNYDILSTQRIVQLIGGTQVVDADQVMVQTKPNGVVFPLLFAPGGATADVVGPLAERYSFQLETALANDAVGGIMIVQDVNPSDQLVDLMEIVALSTSGRSSRVISSPALLYDAPIIIAEAEAARRELDALEGL